MIAAMPIIWIITGPRQVGKTRFCMRLAEKAKSLGCNLAGIYCPPIFEGSYKTGIAIKNLKTGEHHQLANLRTTEVEGLLTDHWIFNQNIMAWANEALADSSASDLFILDELGPLEFKRGEGWQNGLTALDRGNFRTAVVVIRPELVSDAQARWPRAKVMEIPSNLEESLEITLQKQILQNLLS